MNPYAVANQKAYYRFITSGFIHADYVHLGFNMFTLYFFGRNVEQFFAAQFGNSASYLFVCFYLLAIIISEVPTFLKHRNNPNYNSLGASGGVAAVLFASIIIFPTNIISIYAIIPIPGFVVGILYLIYSYYMSRRGKDNINHDAHFYGAIFGVLFILIIHPGVIDNFLYELQNFDLQELMK